MASLFDTKEDRLPGQRPHGGTKLPSSWNIKEERGERKEKEEGKDGGKERGGA